MTRLVAVAHFPPPVHGMAVAVENLVAELETTLAVRRVNIAAPALHRGAGYHLTRVARVARALVVLARERARQAFFSCDAGAGMIYTLVLVTVARLLGYRVLLQHHSYAYLSRRSRLLALIVRLGGDGVVHLVTAPVMAADFLGAYPGAVTRVVGIAADLPLTGAPAGPAPRERLVLGFLGNVTVEKGIALALDTASAATAAGVPVELRVAGPLDPGAVALLALAVDVRLVGPVYGAERDAFLDEVDVLLFPSRYPHESFGLAAWEAMARGRPVLAYRSGCLTAGAVAGGGLVLEHDEDFAAAAAGLLAAWWADPAALAAAGRAAHAAAASVVATSRDQVDRLRSDLTHPPDGALAPSAPKEA